MEWSWVDGPMAVFTVLAIAAIGLYIVLTREQDDRLQLVVTFWFYHGWAYLADDMMTATRNIWEARVWRDPDQAHQAALQVGGHVERIRGH